MNDCCETTRGGNGTAYDLAVIGAGSAGFAAAIEAAERGARVALIGAGTIGGTCVNVGCVPSKMLIRAMETVHQAEAASRFAGLSGTGGITDWAALIAQKDGLVAKLRASKYSDLLSAYDGIAYVAGRARLTDGGVTVDGRMVAAPKVVLATGSSLRLPSLAGLDAVPYLTSTTAMELTALPESMIVLGGGPVGCELGQMFARAGVRVTLVCRSGLLAGGEPEIAAALADCLRGEGMDVRCRVACRAVRHGADGVGLTLEAGGEVSEITAAALLVATGRSPNSAGMGLAEAGVKLAPGGAVVVDAFMRTANRSVYAAGDVTERDMHVYMAAYGGRIAAANALGGDARRYDAAAMPAVTFTDPQAAAVGMTEAAARSAGLDPMTAVLPLAALPRAVAAHDTRGLIKLVAERASGRLLGAHLLAPEAGDAVQTAAMAIKAGMTAAELAATVFPYLTTVEGLKLAAQTFDKDVAMLSCCAG